MSATFLNDGLNDCLQAHRILLTCGTGGVGKTTMAAALGLAAARSRRVLVLTVDPAKRLADALGLRLSVAAPTRVWQAPHGFCDAVQLDTKRTFDALIQRYAPDAAAGRAILANPLYRYLSTLIAGSQEYMAMEKVYDIAAAGTYDLLIVDTPPASHAVDFLQAPQRLVRAMTDSMLRLFLRPSMLAGKWGARLVSRGADLLMTVVGRLAGVELLQEIADLLMGTVGLFGGFRDRAEAVRAMLRSADAACIVVTTPSETAVADAVMFARAVAGEGLRLGGAIVNRATPPAADAATIAIAARAGTDPLAQRLLANARAHAARRTAEQGCITRLRDALPAGAPLVTVPWQTAAIHNTAGLRALAAILSHPTCCKTG